MCVCVWDRQALFSFSQFQPSVTQFSLGHLPNTQTDTFPSLALNFYIRIYIKYSYDLDALNASWTYCCQILISIQSTVWYRAVCYLPPTNIHCGRFKAIMTQWHETEQCYGKPHNLITEWWVCWDESLHRAGLHETLWTCLNVLTKHLPFWIQASVSESHTHCKETPQSVMVVIVLVTALQRYINRVDRMGGDVVILLSLTVISVFTSFIGNYEQSHFWGNGDRQQFPRTHCSHTTSSCSQEAFHRFTG